MPDYANPQNLNRYSHVLNNPLKYTDPTGHWVDEGCGCANQKKTKTKGPKVISGTRVGNSDGDGVFVAPSAPPPPPTVTPTSTPTATPTGTMPSGVATMATVLDTIAMGLNGGYAIVGDIVGLVCQLCYGAVEALYWPFSFIPNSISTVSMGFWIADGAATGENNLTFSPEFSLSVSQDTLIAVGTNLAGWTVLKEPNAAFFVDAGVAAYDYGRLGMIPFTPTIPAFINPTITYSANSVLDFSWQRSR